MMRYSILRDRCALGALALAMGISPGLVHAQDAQEDTEAKDVIVVTGSYIRGTPEDAALPVDVYSSADLTQSGVSSPLEFIKNLPEVGSVLGDSNQFSANAQANQGFGSVNLRNLGPTRTLVLFNGRRTLTAPGAVGGGFGDTNAIPLFALDRVEILKDGAAATYGSDAIAGVANFITKKGFEGVEIQGDYEFIKGSDGNHTASILVGQNFGDLNIMAGIGWQHRSELASTDRSYGFQPYDVNPSAWSALATPGFFIIPGVGARPDVGCAETGGTPDGICRFSFIPFDNLIEEEDRYQGYVQADIDLTDSFRFRGEFTYAQTDLDGIGTSPGYPPLQGPGGAQLGGGFTIDPANPGAQVFANQLGLAAPIAGPIGVFLWRPFGNLGNPTDPGRGSGRQTANNQAFRLSGTFEKDFSETLRGQLSMTWATYERRRSSPGVVGSRLQDALNGLGGANCDPATGTPGVGNCQWFNPFINAGPGHPSLGLTNPFYVPGNENSIELVEFLQIDNGVEETEDTFVVDLIFSGELGIDLGGGPVAWAAGGQYRQLDFLSRPLTVESNLDINPCVILGDQSCIGGSLDGAGSFIFLGGSRPERLSQDVKAVFAEVALPISDTLEITAAARFEDYGGSIGSTFNPKGAIRWEPVDWLVLRGSVGTTFRGPLAAQVSNNANTALAAINAANGNFKAVDIAGNPTDLGPEKAFSYNLGAVVDFGGFTFSVDYWSFDFKDEITTTDAQAIASSVVPVAGGPADCSSPFAALITFDGGTCVQGITNGTNISRILTQWVNGPKTKTSGLDFAASFTADVGPGVFGIGVNASHILKYDIGDFNLGGILLRDGFSAVGSANLDRLPGTISPWRANGYVNFNISGLNLRYGATYIAGVRDERCDGLAFCATTSFGGTNFGRNIESYMQHDFHTAYELPIDAFDAQLQFSIENFTNEEASAARLPLGYNPFIGNTLGRVFRLGAKVGF